MRKSALFAMVTCALGVLLLSGCLERKSSPIGPNVGYGQDISVDGVGVNAVDVLFVIDNSGSMSQEQENLAVQIPALVRDLASPPDRDGDGDADWNPAERLRIGIATTDVGTGVTMVTGSHCVLGGDDGRLEGGVFEWQTGGDPDAFAASVEGVVRGLGIDGCAFEQPLEAAARAIARAPETGFPSEDGLLAVIVVTDEEDCSVVDDDTFFGTAPSGTYNVHCTRNRDLLTPVSTLLAQIQGTRDDDQLVYAAIAGLPRGLTGDETPEALLAHPDMQHVEVDVDPEGLQPRQVCEFTSPTTGASLGKAQPARRLVELAGLLPEGESVLTTICTDDFGPAIERIAGRIGRRIPGVCLVRELPVGVGDEVPCEATITLPEGETCEGRPGYTSLGTEDGHAICSLAQVATGESGGFYYLPASEDGCAQLLIAEDAQPPLGSAVEVECFVNLLSPDGELCARDAQCESGWCDRVERVCAPLPEVPDPGTPPTGG